MRISIIVFSILVLFQNAGLSQKDSTQYALLSETAFAAVFGNDVEKLNEFRPDSKLVRALMGERAISLTNEDIQEKILTPNQNKLKENIQTIQSEIKEEKIDVKEVKYQFYKLENLPGEGEEVEILSIHLEYNGKEETIPMTVIWFEDKLYMLELIYVTDVFKDN